MSGADLRHIETWLFDLDNTLYPAESGLSELFEPKITGYVERITGLPREEAYALQKRYLTEYGLTLKGLMLHHGVDPDDYHAQFADVPLARLEHDGELRAALAGLPGRRLIFTNADEGHTRRVVTQLGLQGLFDEVFHIASAAFLPKPSREAFAALVSRCAVTPEITCFFEDSERNLAPAAALGMTTVLVGSHAADSVAPFVRYRTKRLAPFLAAARVTQRTLA